MWSVKEIKKDALTALKRHWFVNVLIVFLVGLFFRGGYNYASPYSGTELVNYTTTSNEVSNRIGLTSGSVFNVIDNILSEKEIIDIDIQNTVKARYTKGYLSVFVNEISDTGSVLNGIFNGLNKIIFQGKIQESIIVFLVSFVFLVITILLVNPLRVGQNRYFLEQRRYGETKVDKMFFVFKTGKIKNVAWIMFLKNLITNILWFTVIGGAIKHYQYLMIPYILAENPTIKRSDAFSLSKKMMKGQKWRAFVLDCSMLGWVLLSTATIGLLGVFFVNPYQECINEELYIKLRKKIAEENSILLNDNALSLSIFIDSGYPEKSYKVEFLEFSRWITIDYKKNYSFITYIMFFFTFSFVGWFWEVILFLVNEGYFINRGVMYGPWLPIYGVGGFVIIKLLQPFRENPQKMFLSSVIVCGTLEYTTGWALETFFDKKWWDYSGYFLNLNGRICLEGLLVFGLAGVSFTYIFAPLLESLYSRIDPKFKRTLCIVLSIIFILDMGYSFKYPNSGEGITDGYGANTTGIL